MAGKPTSLPLPPDLSSPSLEHVPLAMATFEGEMHIVRYINPAFCRLFDKTTNELVGKAFCEILPENAECLALLDRVYCTGKSESHTEKKRADPRAVFSSYTMWPVTAADRTVGVMLQVVETTPFHEMTLAMNEALILGSLRQHELTAAADSSNIHLQTEIVDRKRREHDAHMLTNEISHRIKNNLQMVISLIGYEARSAAAPCFLGYKAMQARIAAIAKLYDLISQSSDGRTIAVDAYLREIARTMSASLLENTSGIEIEVKAEPLNIDAEYAVPFGLLINELGTNAIKHVFPGGTGRIVLSVERVGDQIELIVADNGVGMKDKDSAKNSEKHGADYVAIFVRQLDGTIAVSGSEGTGTAIAIRLPLHVIPPGGAAPMAA